MHPDEDIQYLKTISLAIKRATDYSQLFAAARRIPVGNCKNFMKLWQEYSTKLNKWWPGSKIYGVEFGDFSGLYELYN